MERRLTRGFGGRRGRSRSELDRRDSADLFEHPGNAQPHFNVGRAREVLLIDDDCSIKDHVRSPNALDTGGRLKGSPLARDRPTRPDMSGTPRAEGRKTVQYGSPNGAGASISTPGESGPFHRPLPVIAMASKVMGAPTTVCDQSANVSSSGFSPSGRLERSRIWHLMMSGLSLVSVIGGEFTARSRSH